MDSPAGVLTRNGGIEKPEKKEKSRKRGRNDNDTEDDGGTRDDTKIAGEGRNVWKLPSGIAIDVVVSTVAGGVSFTGAELTVNGGANLKGWRSDGKDADGKSCWTECRELTELLVEAFRKCDKVHVFGTNKNKNKKCDGTEEKLAVWDSEIVRSFGKSCKEDPIFLRVGEGPAFLLGKRIEDGKEGKARRIELFLKNRPDVMRYLNRVDDVRHQDGNGGDETSPPGQTPPCSPSQAPVSDSSSGSAKGIAEELLDFPDLLSPDLSYPTFASDSMFDKNGGWAVGEEWRVSGFFFDEE